MTVAELDLRRYIRDVPDFPKTGVQFKDIAPLLGDARAFRECINQFLDMYKGESVDRVGAFDARGFLFGPVLAYEMQVPFFPIRKKGKLPGPVVSEPYGLEYGKDEVAVQEDAVLRNDRVLLIDDVLATGGTMRAGCNLVDKLGGSVRSCGFLLELGFLKGREKLNGYDVRSILTY